MGIQRRGIAMFAAAAAMVGVGSGTASAAEVDHWPIVCSANTGCPDWAKGGAVVWGNRTAEVSGSVRDSSKSQYEWVTVYFDAFAGSTKIDSTSRTANNEERPFRFFIGDPNLVGGIDRVRIQVCGHFPATWPFEECGPQYNVWRGEWT
ncbi:hypothetical protein [Tenggerimyces flavus]|uniref:Secreted protein n=1 Tax=Tenggerimyces flavus TaxID=1708749 RepID=A0ABV7YFV0_9ACTN|nr:hypothetical protein [Tenggerimyces flavus]MBM7787969.1 hypothetical protein [Tenggerimyces flavus]